MILLLCFLIVTFMVCGMCGVCQLYTAARTYRRDKRSEYRWLGWTNLLVAVILAVLAVAIHWLAMFAVGVMVWLAVNQLIIGHPNPDEIR